MRDTLVITGVRSIAVAAALLLPGSPLRAQSLVKLVPPDPFPNDHVATSVAASGDTLIAGAPDDDNAGGLNAGKALVYLRNGASWSVQATLFASQPAEERKFGQDVACSGDTAVVASVGDNFAGGTQGGSVYVFERSGTHWSQEALLTASPSKPADGFGRAVALAGDTLVVTSPFANDEEGAAYVYVHSGSSWLLQAELVPDDTHLLGFFGWSVALSGNTVVVGAPSAAAYVFVRSGSSWVQQAKLQAADPDFKAGFAESVAVSGDTVVVGASQDQIGGETNVGSAYVFVRDGTTWSQQAKLIASDATHSDYFGAAVAVADDLAVVGAPFDDDYAGLDAGSAYLFFRAGTTWTEHGKLHAFGASTSAFFGQCASISGDTVVLGAPNDGAQTQPGIGSAYVYGLGIIPWTDLGFGLAGAEGIPLLAGSGSLVAGSSGGLALSLAQPSAPSLLFASLAETAAPFKGGVLHALPPIAQIALGTSADGGWTLPWASWPAGIPAGQKLYFQVAVSDPSAVQGVSLSNVLQATQP